MAVLVTGGYIGSHMVLGLLDNREDVLVIDDLSTGFRLAVQSVKTTALYEQYLLLVSDRLAIEGSEVDARRSCLTEASTLFANAISARLNLG
jgi:UDP-glucose 4-epimerase